ncbi:hypothetical protein [Novosphingobium resinovorum]|uniref:hypothetical protein n=1 Tax=Novosphingobium resinovorum TaxID=158500 RepID=UPI003D2E7AE0
MTESEEILRIASKGDGVTASGRFAWGAAPRRQAAHRRHARMGAASCRAALSPLRPVRGGASCSSSTKESLTAFVEARVAMPPPRRNWGTQALAAPASLAAVVAPPGLAARGKARAGAW